MKITNHSESHIVGLEDGSQWQIFPGDIDLTLGWLPTTDLEIVEMLDDVSSHALVDKAEGARVRVLPLGEKWSTSVVKDVLKDG